MGLNLGLLEGVNEAIQSGLKTYKEERRYQDDKEAKEKDRALDVALRRLQAKQSGYDFDPATGSFSETAEKLTERERAQKKAAREDAEFDPMSEYSRTERERAKGLLKGSRYSGLISDAMTARQVNEALNDANPFLQRESAERIARDRNNKEFANTNKVEFGRLPKESQVEIEKIATSNAGAKSIRAQLQADLALLEDPTVNDEMKLVHARGMIKTLNSQQGQDAVGSEEAKRLASLLEFHIMPNITNPGPMFGRAPIGDFVAQTKNTRDALDRKITNQEKLIQDLYGRSGAPAAAPPVDQATMSAWGAKHGLDDATAAAIIKMRAMGRSTNGVAGR